MDKFTIERKEGNFVMMYKEPIMNKSLSLKARGLLYTIMSFPPSWEFSIKGIVSLTKEGQSAIYSTISELIEQGYCERRYLYENGKRIGADYSFADFPKFSKVEDLNQENLNLENLNLENPTQYNNKENKEIKLSKEEVLEDKRNKFREACQKYVPEYGQKMVDDFVHYWCEANGSKLRCEIAKQKTGCFEIKRRMATWASKSYNNAPVLFGAPSTPQVARVKKTKWEEMGMTEEEYNRFIKG